VYDALMMAVWKRKPPKGLMVHSDRDSQYTSELYQKTLKNHEFICGMSRRGKAGNLVKYPIYGWTLTNLCPSRNHMDVGRRQTVVFRRSGMDAA
jgi:transposase InsO family protein